MTHQPLDGAPPHDLGAEAGVLGSILLDNSCASVVRQVIDSKDFYREAHARIFRAMTELLDSGRGVDHVLVADQLRRRDELDAIGGTEALIALVDATPTAAHAAQYAGILRDMSRLRALRAIGERLRSASPEGASFRELLDESRAALDRVVAWGQAPTIRFHTVEELRALPVSKVEWIVEQILGVGMVTVIASGFKVGKSVLVAALMHCMEEGKPFAGFAVRSPAWTVYLSEEAASGVIEKCDEYGVRRTVFHTREDFDPRASFREFMEAAAAEAKRRGARTLFVDTWRRFSRLAADTERDSGAVQAVIEVALEIAARERLAVCILAHHRKLEGEGGTQVAGSYALGAAVDVLIEVRRAGSGDQRFRRSLSFEGRSLSLPAEELVLELRGREYVRLGQVADLRVERMRSQILSAVDARAPARVTREECLAAAKGKRQAGVEVLNHLFESGVLTRDGTGKSGSPHTFARPLRESPFPSVPVGSGTDVSPGPFSVPPPVGGNEGTESEDGEGVQGPGPESGNGPTPSPAPSPTGSRPGQGTFWLRRALDETVSGEEGGCGG